ncbi:MAG: replicative DNA helicase [Planctomycetes bacterium]|nr:replicative DNA helicase [Planctomycetota bacterium]
MSTAVSPEILDRQPPSDTDAERGVLGSIVLLPEVCDDVAVIIGPDDFYDEAHQTIYRHMLEIHNEGKHVDPLLLIDRLRAADQLEKVGDTAYLAEIFQSVPTAANAVYYADIVHQKAMLRSLIHASTDILRDAYDPTIPPREMVSRAEEKIFRVLDAKVSGEVSDIGKILQEAMDRLDVRTQHKGEIIGGVPTHYSDLDHLLGGLQDSALIIVAARPGMGKTAFALNVAANVSVRGELPVLFVSLEMAELELGDRLLCSEGKVNGHRMRNDTLGQDDLQKLLKTAGVVSQAPLFVDDTPSRTMTEIAANARRLKRREGLRLIVIDYLQLIEPDNARDPRQEQVAKIARRLKFLARELKVPVLCLAQLNRQAESGKEGNYPKLSHLRESGAIEQDADVVMFIHREEYYRQNEDARAEVAGEAEIIVAKQRNGPTGKVNLIWRHEFMRFENSAHVAPHRDLDAFNAAGSPHDF